MTEFRGSWTFLVLQTVLVALWLSANLVLLSRPFDPFPFILLNLVLSFQATYAGPIVLLAGNRQAAKDRAMAQRDDEELGLLVRLQQEQMEILSLLKETQLNQLQILEALGKK